MTSKASVACFKVTDEHPLGIRGELSTGDYQEGEYVISPTESQMLYLAIDGERIAHIYTVELIRLAKFWGYGCKQEREAQP